MRPKDRQLSIDPIALLKFILDHEATLRSIAMKGGYLKISLAINFALAFCFLAMNFGLGFVFNDNVAGLLAAAATWSLPVFLLSLQEIPLHYRYGFWISSCFGGVEMAFAIATAIAGANAQGVRMLVVVILTLPAAAISALLERIFFTAEERLAIQSRHSQRYQTP